MEVSSWEIHLFLWAIYTMAMFKKQDGIYIYAHLKLDGFEKSIQNRKKGPCEFEILNLGPWGCSYLMSRPVGFTFGSNVIYPLVNSYLTMENHHV